MKYRYSKISLDQFAILANENLKPDMSLELKTEFTFSFDSDHNILGVKITIILLHENDTLMKVVATSLFEIDADSVDEIRNEDGAPVFVPASLVQFASLNYGAIRGMLALKTEGTPLHNYILPPLYLNNIITKDFVAK